MTLEGARPQGEEAPTAGHGHGRSGTSRLMEEVVQRDNLKAALARVRQNKGSPGIDGMSTEELSPYLREHWLRIREALLAGTYQPQPVKRHEIPKKGGEARLLGIPDVGSIIPRRSYSGACSLPRKTRIRPEFPYLSPVWTPA